MKKNDYQQGVAAPVVNIADQLTEVDSVLQMHDGFIGPVGYRLINKFEHQARDEKHANQDRRHPAQSPGQGESQSALRNHPRPKVQQKAVEKLTVTLTIDAFF